MRMSFPGRLALSSYDQESSSISPKLPSHLSHQALATGIPTLNSNFPKLSRGTSSQPNVGATSRNWPWGCLQALFHLCFLGEGRRATLPPSSQS